MNKDFYSIVEFAQKLSVHPNTIRRAIKSSRISALRIGKGKNAVYRIPFSEIGRMAKINLDELVELEVEKRLKEMTLS